MEQEGDLASMLFKIIHTISSPWERSEVRLISKNFEKHEHFLPRYFHADILHLRSTLAVL